MKEIFSTTLALILVLLLIAASNEFVSQLAKAAAGELPIAIVWQVVLSSLPSLLIILLPLGFFLGLVLAYGRLYAESEMLVLLACGWSWRDLLKTAFIPAGFFALLTLALQLSVAPGALEYQEKILAEAESDLISYAIKPGRFQKSADGRTILFAETLSADKTEAEEIFIAEQPDEEDAASKWRITTGQRALRWLDENSDKEYVVVEQGHRYEGNPGSKAFTLIDFNRYGIQLAPSAGREEFNIQSVSMAELKQMSSAEARAEWQWRITLPFALFVVVLLAVPLSVVRPRQGKYANLLPAVLTIILYSNFLVLSRSWLEEGATPAWLGIWWVHVIGAGVGLALVAWRSGYWRQKGMLAP